MVTACPVCGEATGHSPPTTWEDPAQTGTYVPAEAKEPAEGSATPWPVVPGYDIVEVLGRGGMGVVYKARQVALKRLVALKMIRTSSPIERHQRERFRIEAEAIARLQHPNIVQIHEIGEQAGQPFFSLEYVAGGSLADKLSGTPLLPREAAALVETLARAMHAAHQQGIVHRDLKPANVLLTDAGEPKIGDFGLAKQMDQDSGQTQDGQAVGTPCYMAPEQAQGELNTVGPLADVYSLGALFYEMLTGRPPFKGATVLETLEQVRSQEPVPPSALQPKVPRDLETICLKCLSKEPGRRYATALELGEDLRRFQQDEPIRARPVGGAERLMRWCRRNRAVAGLIGATAAVLLAATMVSSVLAAWALDERRNAKSQESVAHAAQVDAEREAQNAKTQEGVAQERAAAAKKQAELVTLNMQLVLDEIDAKLATAPALTETRLLLLESIVKAWDQIDASVRDEEEGTAVPTLMVARQKMAGVFLSLGKFDLADEEYRKLYEMAQRRIVVKQGTDGARYNLAVICNGLGDMRQRVHRDMVRSHEYYEEALGLLRDIQENPKPDPKQGSMKQYVVRMTLSTVLQNLGVSHLRSGRLKQASEYFERALVQREQLLQGLGSDPEFQAEERFRRRAAESEMSMALDKSYLARAEVLFRLGDFSACERLKLASVERRRALFESDPRDVANKVEYFCAHVGEFYPSRGRSRYSLPLLERAVALLTEVSAENPMVTTYTGHLMQACFRLGCVRDELSDPDGAVAEFQQCRRLLSSNASSGDQKDQAWSVLFMARCGQVEAASQLAEELGRSSKPDPELDLLRARALAQCSRVAKTEEQRKSLMNTAFQALERVYAAGYRDPTKVRLEPDLKSLREDPRFAETLAKMTSGS